MNPASPTVRLQINITDQKVAECHSQERDKEVIRRVTKSYEVVEVDGFVFKRKRRGTVSAPAAADLTAKIEVQSAAAAHIDSSVRASADTAHEMSSAAEPMEQASCEAADAAAEPKDIGEEAVAANGRAALTVIGGGNVAAQEPGNGLILIKRFRVADQRLHGDGSGEGSGGSVTSHPVGTAQTIDHVLSQVPEGLSQTEHVARLCQIVAADELAALSRRPSDEGPGAAVPVLETAVVSGEHACQSPVSLRDSWLTNAEASAKAAIRAIMESFAAVVAAAATEAGGGSGREADHAAALAADLAARKEGARARLAQLQQEADAWEAALEEAGRCDSKDTPAAPADVEMRPASESAAALSDASATALAALRQAEAVATHASILKAEGLVAMVGWLEQLVDAAERHISVMQADYHQQMFAPYAHVDSPARLIKAMIRDGPPPPPPPSP